MVVKLVVDTVFFVDDDYGCHNVPAFEAPPQGPLNLTPTLRILFEDNPDINKHTRLRHIEDQKGDKWRVITSHEDAKWIPNPNPVSIDWKDWEKHSPGTFGEPFGLSLSCEKWFEDYDYSERITCSCGCGANTVRISRIVDGEKEYCPLIRWAVKDDKYYYWNCLYPIKRQPPTITEDGGVYLGVCLNLDDTLNDLNSFHDECTAYAAWFGFHDPNPVKFK